MYEVSDKIMLKRCCFKFVAYLLISKTERLIKATLLLGRIARIA